MDVITYPCHRLLKLPAWNENMTKLVLLWHLNISCYHAKFVKKQQTNMKNRIIKGAHLTPVHCSSLRGLRGIKPYFFRTWENLTHLSSGVSCGLKLFLKSCFSICFEYLHCYGKNPNSNALTVCVCVVCNWDCKRSSILVRRGFIRSDPSSLMALQIVTTTTCNNKIGIVTTLGFACDPKDRYQWTEGSQCHAHWCLFTTPRIFAMAVTHSAVRWWPVDDNA